MLAYYPRLSGTLSNSVASSIVIGIYTFPFVLTVLFGWPVAHLGSLPRAKIAPEGGSRHRGIPDFSHSYGWRRRCRAPYYGRRDPASIRECMIRGLMVYARTELDDAGGPLRRKHLAYLLNGRLIGAEGGREDRRGHRSIYTEESQRVFIRLKVFFATLSLFQSGVCLVSPIPIIPPSLSPPASTNQLTTQQVKQTRINRAASSIIQGCACMHG